MAESNKTEKPTPQRRKKAREQGQVVRSREFGALLGLVTALMIARIQATTMAQQWTSFYNGLLNTASAGDLTASGPVLYGTALQVLEWSAPALIGALLCSTAVTLAQGGFNFAPTALSFKFERISPGSRMGQIMSFASLGGLLRSFIPLIVIAVLGAAAVQANWMQLTRASGQNAGSAAKLVGDLLQGIVWKSAIVLFVSAAVDYALLWRQSEGKLRMSHDEIKREYKENDGNPVIKAQVRKKQRAMRARKPLEAAATATMVITNPTHFAIALRYEPSMAAPEVVAKGQDLLAQKIKALAAENNVPTIENKLLARALYKAVEVGQTIPPEFYHAIAEILVAVFRAQEEVQQQNARKRRLNAAGEMVDPQ